ncbi:MAG: glucose-6-phosphate isomerase [Firmicutes bacterium]|nr:glucose-6-phosphate isomerase [Bacillota bacterium]
MAILRQPFNTHLNLGNGVLVPEGVKVVRHLSDMKDMYQDQDAVQHLLKDGDPLIYVVYNVEVPEEAGELQHCTSIVYPGRVGNEFFMTKGHFHSRAGTAEIYLTLRGRGILLMQAQDGRTATLDMFPGSVSYILPYWAHRSINVGPEPLVFFAVYPGDAGHNYGVIEEKGFAKMVLAQDDAPVVVDNPRYACRRT